MNIFLTFCIKIYRIVYYFFNGLVILCFFFPKNFALGLEYIFERNSPKFSDRIDNLKNNNSNKVGYDISKIMFFLSICVYLMSVFIVSKWLFAGQKTEKLGEEVVKSAEISEQEVVVSDEDEIAEVVVDENAGTTSEYSNYNDFAITNINFDNLLKTNDQTVGWIKINNTKINYPIVQTNDNSYYLNHSFNFSDNSGGWIFADYRNNFVDFDRNNIIYGHNLINKTMFGTLTYALHDWWINDVSNHYINVVTPTKNTLWQIFSVYLTAPETYYIKTSFGNDESFNSFLTTIKQRSMYSLDVAVGANDKVLTLSTCDDSGTQRLVVHAKLYRMEDR
ncbi:MAG: class B sortase [bacterium]|nr:class B sortase [bacterium]